MITGTLLIEWAIRSALLIATGALVLALLRIKDPSIRLAACIAAVCGSLAIPLLTSTLPKLPVILAEPASAAAPPLMPAVHWAIPAGISGHAPQTPAATSSVSIGTILLRAYAIVAGLLLLRLGLGLLLAHKLRRRSRPVEVTATGAEIRESNEVTAPVTVGLLRPVILLPADWRGWDDAKRNAVLAHEQSHVHRRDPAVQTLSALHRAILWHSPLSWLLHRHIVRLAEDVSDDAALAVASDRASYAEMLLDFMRGGVRVHGVAMARYGSAEARIHRILNSTLLSKGLPRGAAALILLLAVPLAYVTAAAVPSRRIRAVASTAAVARPAALAAVAQVPVPAGPKPAAPVRRYIMVLGNTQSGSWDSSDSVRPETLRARYGTRFLWFRQGGADRVITDAGVMAELEQALEPQKKVNAQQDQVNRLQSAVNAQQDKVNTQQNGVNGEQDKVNREQDKVNRAQDTVNKRQDLLNRIQEAGARGSKEDAVRKLEALLAELRTAPGAASQDEVNRLQAQVNEQQHRVNGLQDTVNQAQAQVNGEQQKVNAEQAKVNAVQHQVSAEFDRRLQQIFDSAIRRGLAQPAQ